MNHGLNAEILAVAAGCVVLWSVLSARLERFNVSAPIAFVVMGIVVTHGPLAFVHFSPHSESVKSLAEVTLALVLFTDASRVNIHELRADVGLPVRLLAIGLPLSIGFGTAIAFGIIPGMTLWVAATVGAIVAPTDAALGSAIMSDERVPNRIRRLLNVESGLNDGIATPFVNLFLAGAISSEVAYGPSIASAVSELAVGAGVGLGLGLIGGWVLSVTRSHGWAAKPSESLVAPALALAGYSLALVLHGNGFIAAFIAGIAFGSVLHGDLAPLVEFGEEAGGLLSLLVWLIFGAAMVIPGFEHATWADVAFAVLALTIIRMVPVAISLLGSGLDRVTVSFIGWFGPRGLASVVFGLIAFDTLDPTAGSQVLAIVTVTITLSVVAHGISASPLAARYGRFATTLSAHEPEHQPTPIMRAHGAKQRPPTPQTYDDRAS